MNKLLVFPPFQKKILTGITTLYNFNFFYTGDKDPKL